MVLEGEVGCGGAGGGGGWGGGGGGGKVWWCVCRGGGGGGAECRLRIINSRWRSWSKSIFTSSTMRFFR